jgi:serine/threonine-protein kinase
MPTKEQVILTESASPMPEATLATPALATSEAKRRALMRSLRLGIWIWPTFTLLDAWMCFIAWPGAPFGLFLAIRVVVEVLLVAVYRASRSPLVSVPRLAFWLNLSYTAAAAGIAVMATWLGGVRSPYMHGISLVALVRAATIPESWRRAWPSFAAIALVFPVVMTAGALFRPSTRADWFAVDAMIAFVSNYVFVLSSAVIGMLTSSMMWHAQQQLYRARRVGRYRLLAPIGKGGMGEVWLAWDLSLQRNVALKLLRVGESAGPEMVARFEREALAASRLRSPHVIQIFDYGASDDGLYYIVMEYLNGVNLQDLVEREGALAPLRAVRFAMQACLALEEAHRHGVIHRDIKPHNLFVATVDDGSEQVKLLDFGIVRLPETGGELTVTGVLVGTPVYVAPEVWAGAPADEQSDLYALGITLYFLLAGRLPFDLSTIATTGRHPAPLFPDTDQPALRDLAALVRQCLAIDPAQRVQSASALWAELDRLAARLV